VSTGHSSDHAVQEELAPLEVWDDPVRGNVGFRTLFSSETTGSRALTTGVAELPVGGWLATHRHVQPEVYYVLAGAGLARVGDDEIEVSAGSAVELPSGVRHSLTNTGPDVLRLVYTLAADGMSQVHYEFG